MTRVLVWAVFLLTLPLIAGAQPEEKSVAQLRAEAVKGDAAAQTELGDRLAFGAGQHDFAEAVKWYRAAATQGNAEAAHSLGLLYHSGRGVPRDQAEAFKWWKVAADKGHASAQFWVGDAYQHGAGVAQSSAEAAKWYRSSAEQGDPYGQSSLGVLYENGLGVPLDEGEAVNWYRKAAEQRIPSGQFNLGKMYWDGRGVKRDEAAALGWFHQAADQDFTVAQTAIGEAYEAGRGVAQDLTCAYFWYGIAERSGFDVGTDNMRALAPRMAPGAIEEAKRLIAASKVEDGVLSRPLCAGEPVSLSLSSADIRDVLGIFGRITGYEIKTPADLSGVVKVKVDDVPWERALTEALASAGYRWSRDGMVIKVERTAK
jgi:TPR repeat protein